MILHYVVEVKQDGQWLACEAEFGRVFNKALTPACLRENKATSEEALKLAYNALVFECEKKVLLTQTLFNCLLDREPLKEEDRIYPRLSPVKPEASYVTEATADERDKWAYSLTLKDFDDYQWDTAVHTESGTWRGTMLHRIYDVTIILRGIQQQLAMIARNQGANNDNVRMLMMFT